MPSNEPVTPCEMALVELRARIADDKRLEQDVRDALSEDLISADPAAFERLKAMLTEKTYGNEAERPKGQ